MRVGKRAPAFSKGQVISPYRADLQTRVGACRTGQSQAVMAFADTVILPGIGNVRRARGRFPHLPIVTRDVQHRVVRCTSRLGRSHSRPTASRLRSLLRCLSVLADPWVTLWAVFHFRCFPLSRGATQHRVSAAVACVEGGRMKRLAVFFPNRPVIGPRDGCRTSRGPCWEQFGASRAEGLRFWSGPA